MCQPPTAYQMYSALCARAKVTTEHLRACEVARPVDSGLKFRTICHIIVFYDATQPTALRGLAPFSIATRVLKVRLLHSMQLRSPT